MEDLIDVKPEETKIEEILSTDPNFTRVKLSRTIELCEGILSKAMKSNTKDTSGKFMEGCATTVRSMLLAIESLHNLDMKEKNAGKVEPIVIQSTLPVETNTNTGTTNTTLSDIINELNKAKSLNEE